MSKLWWYFSRMNQGSVLISWWKPGSAQTTVTWLKCLLRHRLLCGKYVSCTITFLRKSQTTSQASIITVEYQMTMQFFPALCFTFSDAALAPPPCTTSHLHKHRLYVSIRFPLAKWRLQTSRCAWKPFLYCKSILWKTPRLDSIIFPEHLPNRCVSKPKRLQLLWLLPKTVFVYGKIYLFGCVLFFWGGLFGVSFSVWHVHCLVTWRPDACCTQTLLLFAGVSPFFSTNEYNLFIFLWQAHFLSTDPNFWPIFHDDRLETFFLIIISVSPMQRGLWAALSLNQARLRRRLNSPCIRAFGQLRVSCCTVTDPALRPQSRAGNGPDNFPTGINKPSAQWEKEDALCLSLQTPT